MPTLADILRQTGYSQNGTLNAPATESPMTKALANHLASLPQTTAQNLAKQRQDIDAALQMTPQGIQIADKDAFGRFMNEMPNVAGMMAYHGTPHKIVGKFDVNKIGTGEGNQSFGHGMYFAESPEVAKTYKQDFLQSDATIKSLQKFRDEASKGSADWEHYNTLMNRNKEGNLYKVDIPDEHIPNMLDYEKAVDISNPAVKDAAKIVYEFRKSQGNPRANVSFEEFAKKEFGKNSNLYDDLDLALGGQDKASQFLADRGIPGIKYLDEGSRGKGNGTYNYVVFDPSTIKILEENGKPLTRKEMLTQEAEKALGK